MKKTLIILAILMTFTFVACGANYDENNAMIQVKMDKSVELFKDLVKLYDENGMAGDLDDGVKTMDETVEQHNQLIADGGYNDEAAAEFASILDDANKTYEAAIKEMKAAFAEQAEALAAVAELEAAQAAEAEEAAKVARGELAVEVISEKYNTLVDLVNEVSEKGSENGWEGSDNFNSEVDAAIQICDQIYADLQTPENIDDVYLKSMVVVLDDTIPLFRNYSEIVKDKFIGE